MEGLASAPDRDHDLTQPGWGNGPGHPTDLPDNLLVSQSGHILFEHREHKNPTAESLRGAPTWRRLSTARAGASPAKGSNGWAGRPGPDHWPGASPTPSNEAPSQGSSSPSTREVPD